MSGPGGGENPAFDHLLHAVEALRGPAGAITFAVDATDARATAARLRAVGHRRFGG